MLGIGIGSLLVIVLVIGLICINLAVLLGGYFAEEVKCDNGSYKCFNNEECEKKDTCLYRMLVEDEERRYGK